MRCAFTLIEVLVAIGIIVVLIGILLVAVGRARRSAESTACLANLHGIALAFHQYAANHAGRLPDPGEQGTPWEVLLCTYFAPSALRCGADSEAFPTLGSSYDWRDTGDPSTTLAGRKITDVNRSDVVMVYEALPAWHAERRMNAAQVDGSARTMDQEECLGDITTPVR